MSIKDQDWLNCIQVVIAFIKRSHLLYFGHVSFSLVQSAHTLFPFNLSVNNILFKYKLHQDTTDISQIYHIECLPRDGRAAGSSLTGVTALWSLSKTNLS